MAAPQSLQVETVSRSFTFTLADQHLFFRSNAGSGSIKRTACSEPLIASFWSEANAEIKRFPKIKGGTLKPAAILNGQRHLLRSLRSPATIKNLDRQFHALQFQERTKCGQK